MNRINFFIMTLITFCFTKAALAEDDIASKDKAISRDKGVSRPVSPFESYITGVGIVEASSENIFIGVPVQRLVEKVLVTVGTELKKGDILLRLENRDLEADLQSKRVAYEIAIAKVKRLQALPRPEEVAATESDLSIAELEMNQMRKQYEMVESLQNSRALSKEEINRRFFNYQQAQVKWHQAQVNLSKIKAGTWALDLDISQLEALQAKAETNKAQADIERTIIRSPIDGKVLQIKIHEGEFPPLDTFRTPIMVVGNTDEKYLEVSINQFNASFFNPDAPAVAFLQGDGRLDFPLEFVHLEPYLVNKQNLSNAITEKVDTRVLQVTYRFKKGPQNIYVGQQMDVFIKTEKTP